MCTILTKNNKPFIDHIFNVIEIKILKLFIVILNLEWFIFKFNSACIIVCQVFTARYFFCFVPMLLRISLPLIV